jgi:D-sedoheptulose 7-phosphate isomerase
MLKNGILLQNIRDSINAKTQALQSEVFLNQFERAAEALVKCYKQGNKLIVAGNGGSAADAQHLVAEFVSKLARDRDPLPAEALTVDTSIITAIGNDYGYDKVFSRQIHGKAHKGDIFLGITTSGNSPNIVEALKACRKKRVTSILLSAKSGGEAIHYADYPILVPGERTSCIQEMHIVIEHTLCEIVENSIFGEI